MSPNSKPEELSRMILNYLEKSPDAADTLEGITRWWLEFERVELSLNDVKDALENLIQKGMVRMLKTKMALLHLRLKRKIQRNCKN